MVHDFTSAHTPGFIPSSEAAGEDSGSGVGRHTHAWQSCRRGARPACAALPVHTHPSCPLGTCVHKRVRHAGWACRRCTRVRWMYSTPFDWIISGVLSGAPCTGFAGVCGAGWSSGHPLAASTPASLRSMQEMVHPFIYSNIFAFPRQPKHDKALLRRLSIPSRLIRLQTQLGLLGMALDAFVLPKRA